MKTTVPMELPTRAELRAPIEIAVHRVLYWGQSADRVAREEGVNIITLIDRVARLRLDLVDSKPEFYEETVAWLTNDPTIQTELFHLSQLLEWGQGQATERNLARQRINRVIVRAAQLAAQLGDSQ